MPLMQARILADALLVRCRISEELKRIEQSCARLFPCTGRDLAKDEECCSGIISILRWCCCALWLPAPPNERDAGDSHHVLFLSRACLVRPRPADEAILRPAAFRRNGRRIPLRRRRSASRVRAFTHSDCSERHKSLADDCGISPTRKNPAK